MNHFMQRRCGVLISLLVLILLSSCGFPGMTSTTAQLPIVKRQDAQTIPVLPPVHLPEDEGSHNYLTEWWYYTGHLQARDEQGKTRQYGFEFVIFQVSRSTLPLIFPTHFAITDLSRQQFHYEQRRIAKPREQVPLGTTSRGIDIAAGDWTMKGSNGHDQIAASMQDYAINLKLDEQKPASLHNETGLIPYGLGGFSYYYSRTRMSLTGSLLDHGQSLQVTGQAWMDHQWGNFLALDGGWDWYSLQLDNATEMMLYFVRNASGKVVSTYVGYVDQTGKNTILPPTALRLDVLEQWTSPKTGITYPSGWKITINDPRLQTVLTVKPQLKNQELVTTASTGNIYWEGAVSISGQVSGKPVQGAGYIELTGYAKL